MNPARPIAFLCPTLAIAVEEAKWAVNHGEQIGDFKFLAPLEKSHVLSYEFSEVRVSSLLFEVKGGWELFLVAMSRVRE